MLLRMQGHQVEVVDDGLAAVAAIVARKPEVAFLDIGMPHCNGYQAAARLRELHAASRAAGALLLIGEAHALGVVGAQGRGAAWEAGLAAEPDVVLTVTPAKALGSQGGAVLGPAAVRAHLVDTARPFIFDTGLAPPPTAAALAALRLLDDELVGRVRTRAQQIAAALGVRAGDGAVVPVVLGTAARAAAARDACLADGVLVGCFRPPAVPPGGSCLRLTARADLSASDVRRAAEVVLRSVAA